MSICMDHYCADERLILGAHVVPGHWLLQGELQEAAVSCAGWKRNLETGNERKESEGRQLSGSDERRGKSNSGG